MNAHGIERQYTCRNRPQQNGVAERANRVLAERITAMLNESGLPRTFWAECLAALVHVWNRLPTSAIPNSTPFEQWYKRKPGIGHIRVWGCVAYVHVQKDKRAHFGSHYEKCIFIGYADGYKGWKFYNPTTRKVVISERADFDERYMYYNKSLSMPPPHPQNSEPNDESNSSDYTPGYGYTEQHKKPPPTGDLHENKDHTTACDKDDSETSESSSSSDPSITDNQDKFVTAQGHQEQSDSNSSTSSDDEQESELPLAVRRPRRNVRPPGEWWKARQPTPAIPDTDDESDQSANVVVAGEFEPPTYKQAMKDQHADKWKDAMTEEINAHLENGTWSIVQLPPGQKAIGSKWVYRIKHKADGSVERFKARIVAQGFSQRPGYDYTETFASTMRAASIRTILALAAIEDLHLRSVDISHAFINSDIDAEIYMKQPEGFQQNGPEYVCKLNKSLYGLKQSPRLWSKRLAEVLTHMGFKQLKSDPSIYIFVKDNVKVIVPVFVDDITLASASTTALDDFVTELAKHFKLRDLGPTEYLLGIEITRNRAQRQIQLCQKQYIINKLEEFGMTDCATVKTPMNPGAVLTKEQCPKSPEAVARMQNIPYMNAVGSLMYLAIMTRPDIAYSVGVLARFNSNPGIEHWNAVKHLFRYLKGTMDLKLTYKPSTTSNDLFITYCDADHGGNKDNGKSTTGYLVKIGSGAVSWSSKLQSVVTLSSTEAEYVAAMAAGKEICWMVNLLTELGYKSPQPAQLNIDNQSTITVTKNPEHHGRMKHLDLDYHWLREKVEMKAIAPVYLQTDEMPADLLTKPLPRVKVEQLREAMGLMNS